MMTIIFVLEQPKNMIEIKFGVNHIYRALYIYKFVEIVFLYFSV